LNQVYLSGIIPTPGVSYLVSSKGFDMGIVISASHNPYFDNGIKLFKQNGRKLSEKEEAEIEQIILDSKIPASDVNGCSISRAFDYPNAISDYLLFLKECLDQIDSIKGLNITLDCANGSTSKIAPDLFEDLGANVQAFFDHPDGKNINEACGSEHPDIMSQKVIEKGSDIGIAFDGDGDRVIVADETGVILTGDQIIAIFASFLKHRDELNNNMVISTIMSNLGLSISLRNMNIFHSTTEVGDRYVAEKMIDTGAILGGENSGHIILMNKQKTGDGLLTALKLLEVMKLEDKPLSELKKIMQIYPQTLMNVEVTKKPDLRTLPDVQNAIHAIEKKLGNEGRVVLRYSGTQPICRIMIEGPTKEVTEGYCRELSGIIEECIG